MVGAEGLLVCPEVDDRVHVLEDRVDPQGPFRDRSAIGPLPRLLCPFPFAFPFAFACALALAGVGGTVVCRTARWRTSFSKKYTSFRSVTVALSSNPHLLQNSYLID